MKNVLTISPLKEVARLINSTLPSDYNKVIAAGIKEGLKLHRQHRFDLILSDLNVLRDGFSANNYAEAIKPFKEVNSQVKIVFLSPKERGQETVKTLQDDVDGYLTYPIHPAKVRLVVESLSESLTQNLELDYLRDQFWKPEWLDVIHSRTVAMQEVFAKLRAVALTKATVLLTGEIGTGKTLYAGLLHAHSNRSDNPFISVHCGAIPDTLLESELFGHEKGAFTGAIRRKLGKFELAKSGTIFLDEIGTLTPIAQIKLLQVLQDGTFSRVGGEEILKTDARVIAATNADLTGMNERGDFRKDLFYRLNIFPVEIPPLRERLDDIPYFVEVFLKKLNQKHGKNIHVFHPHILQALKKYNWPGNIRELENLMERAYILETTAMLTPESFHQDLMQSVDLPASLPNNNHLPLSEARRQVIDDFERQYLKELFACNKGKVSRTAEDAGISTRQLNKLMVKYEIQKEMFKN